VRVNEAVIGALLLALMAAVFAATAAFPRIPGQPYGPDLFPRMIAGGLGIAGVLMVLRGLLSRPRLPLAALAPWARSARSAGAVALALAGIVFYILAADSLGFVISAFALLAVLMLYLRVPLLTAAITAAASTLVVEYTFGSLMRIPLPRGLLVVLA
jgi:putative tricarboxylic transport membrane protein